MLRKNEIWDVSGHADQLEKCWGSPDEERGRHWELLKAVAELVRGKSVLDVGCGMGHFYEVLLKERPDVSYFGFDNSIKMLDKAHDFHPNNSTRFVIGDVFDMSNFATVDTVVSVSLLLHLPSIKVPIQQMWSKTEKELILTLRIDKKGFFHRRPYSGVIKLPPDKRLIIRGVRLSALFSAFGMLEDVGSVETFHYDTRSTIFRLTRRIPKYGSFRRGWLEPE